MCKLVFLMGHIISPGVCIFTVRLSMYYIKIYKKSRTESREENFRVDLNSLWEAFRKFKMHVFGRQHILIELSLDGHTIFTLRPCDRRLPTPALNYQTTNPKTDGALGSGTQKCIQMFYHRKSTSKNLYFSIISS